MIETLILSWVVNWESGKPVYSTYDTHDECWEMIEALRDDRPRLDFVGMYDDRAGRCEIVIFGTIR